MALFFVYILKSSLCLAAFYLFYRLLLAHDTFHRFNRVALLGILVLSCVLPLVEVSVAQASGVPQPMLTLEELLAAYDAASGGDAVSVGDAASAGEGASAWIGWLLLVYGAGVIFFLCRQVYSLCRMRMLLKEGTYEYIGRYLPGRSTHAVLVVHDRPIAPFSWMKYIVISRKDLEEDGREILIHELAHIRNHHSWDLLLTDLCIFLQWFNPAAWLLKQELQNIHEYEADETVINEGVDAKRYQLLLIKKAVGTRLYSMANSFNHSKLKKRITMMLKEKSSPWARLKYLYVLPLTAIAITAFARPEVSATAEEISAVKVNDLAAMLETKAAENASAAPDTAFKPKYSPIAVIGVEYPESEPLNVVEQMPEYPEDGMRGLMMYLNKTVRYPKSAMAKGFQGRVVVQFVVAEDGSIQSPKVVRSVDADLDAEAMRVISGMPKWKPGMKDGKPVAVKFSVPVMFTLQGYEKAEAEKGSALDSVAIYVDGVRIENASLAGIPTDSIADVTVKKDENSIYVTTKKGR
ncbi:MAG: TonB family protein [Bacteroides sp.]|nr:TonB family protein [Bacteroides sp.]